MQHFNINLRGKIASKDKDYYLYFFLFGSKSKLFSQGNGQSNVLNYALFTEMVGKMKGYGKRAEPDIGQNVMMGFLILDQRSVLYRGWVKLSRTIFIISSQDSTSNPASYF